MMKTNTAEVGKRIACPDGEGVVSQILNPDVVMIQLDRVGSNGKNLIARFDLSECKALETHNPPVQREYTEEELTRPIVAVEQPLAETPEAPQAVV